MEQWNKQHVEKTNNHMLYMNKLCSQKYWTEKICSQKYV
jgi:hypothetical protein